MTNHVSARVAWHMDGWNGHICRNPAANTYCVGQFSFPGTRIAESRNLAWEQENSGRCCSEVDGIPPCISSINAFGAKPLTAYADPPAFFNDQTRRREWDLAPATVCIWPYEEMYEDQRRKDTKDRIAGAKNFLGSIEENRSLVFYYANYSNPFNIEDTRCYVVVGVSRVKKVGDLLYYENCSPRTLERYGGFVWQCNLTSHYPDQGFRIPYHLYMDNQEVLDKIVLVPSNPRNFKYAARIISDDDALDLIEHFLEIANTLKELGDTSENWPVRTGWLQSLIGELWKSRGLYPGLTAVLDYLDFGVAIPYFKQQTATQDEHNAKDALFAFLEGRTPSITGLTLTSESSRRVLRQWKLKTEEEKNLLRDTLPRFDLRPDQIKRILSSERIANGIEALLPAISENPYYLSEQFIGDGPDDSIPFNKIDHGVYPSPELGGDFLFPETDDGRRLRALSVEQLKREDKDCFIEASQLIHTINRRLSFLPEWKRHQFTEQYLEIEKEELSEALTLREENRRTYLYLKSIFEAERSIERQIRALAGRPDISFKMPLTEGHWHTYLYHEESPLAVENPAHYDGVIREQVQVCQKIFVRPICVLSGAAGTGKTTVIKALIQGIEKAHGTGTSFQLLAPTGKAADRIREATEKPAATIHSFLAQHHWLNANMTYKRSGGDKEEKYLTYIIDEASMLDLELIAALFRAINWASVQRLIFVGDPNQLPPIGRGRVFADLIDWLQEHSPESVGFLTTNIRQMENRLKGEGTGILDLASLYVRTKLTTEKDEGAKVEAEDILRRVQEGGDIDKDLRILFWKDPDELAQKLTDTIVTDMERDTGKAFNADRPFELWQTAFRSNGEMRPEYLQVISPYRGDQFGVEHINKVLQKHARGRLLERGNLAGIALFDKVIQVINRSRSSSISCYNLQSRKSERVEVYNGELGFVRPFAPDGDKWKSSYYHLKHFQVVFSRKAHLWVDYKSDREVEENLELAYAISVHKSQGSEFERIYFVLPRDKVILLSRELFYTGITRARRHCTILVQEDISPLLSMRRPEKSYLVGINASLFSFHPLPNEMRTMSEWYVEGKIHQTLADIMVRSKSEVIIANMLAEREIPFQYEMPLYAPDGTFYLPDFTITWAGEAWYWEHLGRLDNEEYRNHWEAKKAWYDLFFPGRLLTTEESGDLSKEANELIELHFS
jgi:exodeoxyribonuclease V alpha subunit